MLLLYSSDPAPEERAERMAEMPLWMEVTESLRESGLRPIIDFAAAPAPGEAAEAQT
jgi:hypothetical protein